jgi:hypothetical protein
MCIGLSHILYNEPILVPFQGLPTMTTEKMAVATTGLGYAEVKQMGIYLLGLQQAAQLSQFML